MPMVPAPIPMIRLRPSIGELRLRSCLWVAGALSLGTSVARAQPDLAPEPAPAEPTAAEDAQTPAEPGPAPSQPAPIAAPAAESPRPPPAPTAASVPVTEAKPDDPVEAQTEKQPPED